ncbi:MAG: hypothetical protein ACHQYP_11170 [Nitrospiria bacterium]
MPDKNVWKIEDPARVSSPQKEALDNDAGQDKFDRSPAVAFSLSLLIWGGGQIYNRQHALGVLFIFLMANFWIDITLAGVFWQSMITTFNGAKIYPVALIGCGIFYILGLIFWIFNAFQAYRHANKADAEMFQGVNSVLLPLICSFFVPGWGQFLNGQPKKGLCFLIFTLAGLISVPVLVLIPDFWSGLETFNDRLLIEKILIIAVVFLPLIIIMWVVSVYDAVKVSLDPVKKEPIGKRVEYAINRFRMNGFSRFVLPTGKRILMFSLLLGFLLILCYQYFPTKNYTDIMQNLHSRLSQKGMVFVPRLIEQILQTAESQRPHR